MSVLTALLLPGGQGRGSGEQALPLLQVRGADGPVTVELVVDEPGGVLLLGQHCLDVPPHLLQKNMFFGSFLSIIFADLREKNHTNSVEPTGYGFSLDREPTEGRAGRPAAGRYRNIPYGWLVCPGQCGIFSPSAQPSNTGRMMRTEVAMMTVYRWFMVDKKLSLQIT